MSFSPSSSTPTAMSRRRFIRSLPIAGLIVACFSLFRSDPRALAQLEADTPATSAPSAVPPLPVPPQRPHPVGSEARDKPGDPLCDDILMSEKSMAGLWNELSSRITEVSLLHDGKYNDIRSNNNFTSWVNETMRLFNSYTMERSSGPHPASEKDILHVQRLLRRKLQSPDDADPLRIMVFGGSITAGHQCNDNFYSFHMSKKKQARFKNHANLAISVCAWPARLQDMMDAVFGAGIVHVQNMAVGGAGSPLSSMVIEYGLWPEGYPPEGPDVVIWDHGANDYFEDKKSDVMLRSSLKLFYEHARSLHCKDPHRPLIIYLDSFPAMHDFTAGQALASTQAFQKFLAWYPGVMGVSYTSVVRPYLMSTDFGPDGTRRIRLFGTTYLTVHPGMMYHISVAWVMLYNFLKGVRSTCRLPSSTDEISSSSVWDLLSPAHVPGYREDLKLQDIYAEWQSEGKSQIEKCRGSGTDSGPRCPYVWMVNTMTGVSSPPHVEAKIKPYLTSISGWEAKGNRIRNPRTGWLAHGPQASFGMKFDLKQRVQTLTILRMLSYSEDWVNATLQVDCTVEAKTPGSNSATVTHLVSGYHEKKTSILVPVVLDLPPFSVGDLLHLNFTLVSGSTFKISGLGLCN